MYVYSNEELNEILKQEGFLADLDENQELEVVVETVEFEDEMIGEIL